MMATRDGGTIVEGTMLVEKWRRTPLTLYTEAAHLNLVDSRQAIQSSSEPAQATLRQTRISSKGTVARDITSDFVRASSSPYTLSNARSAVLIYAQRYT